MLFSAVGMASAFLLALDGSIQSIDNTGIRALVALGDCQSHISKFFHVGEVTASEKKVTTGLLRASAKVLKRITHQLRRLPVGPLPKLKELSKAFRRRLNRYQRQRGLHLDQHLWSLGQK